MRRFVLAVVIGVALGADAASAQSLSADAHFAIARWHAGSGTFNDYGIGGRLTWKPSAAIGLDANLVWYPGGFPPETDVPISAWRMEGLFGATVGPRIGRVRPFAKAGAGFLTIGAAPQGVVCVAIFPTPIWCTLGGGTTLPAVEFGGGLEVDAGSSGFIRADIGARMLKYPGPAIDAEFQLRDADYWERGLRLTFGAGLRF